MFSRTLPVLAAILESASDTGLALIAAGNAAAQRALLGLGNAATRNVGTGPGDVAAGNMVGGGSQPIENQDYLEFTTTENALLLRVLLRVASQSSPRQWRGEIFVGYDEVTQEVIWTTVSVSGDLSLVGDPVVEGSLGARTIRVPFQETVSGAMQPAQI